MKALEKRKDGIALLQRPFGLEDWERFDGVCKELSTKQLQEETALEEITRHNRRDSEIRAFLKRTTDYFRRIEEEYKKWEPKEENRDRTIPFGWRTRRFDEMLTHQHESRCTEFYPECIFGYYTS